jgi:CubicO group peptidase (beta-lactamase class C family)
MTILDNLESLLTESVQRHRVPGATVSILWDDKIYEAAAGVINAATGVSCTIDAVFPFGSVTKTITATAALRLAELGKLDLDAKVAEVVPEFQPANEQLRDVRIRHLLTHTSGLIGTIFADTGRNPDALARQIPNINAAPAFHRPGELLSYCNSGMLLLGRAIEHVTRKSWDDAVQELVATPLGITTIVTRPEAALRMRTAIGHMFDPEAQRWLVEPHPFMLPGHAPAGSTMAGRARDLIVLARAYLDAFRRRSASSFLESTTAVTAWNVQAPSPAPFTVLGWGLGWTIYDWHGSRVVGHDGATAGTKAYLRVAPDRGLAAALLVNAPTGLLVYEDVMGELFRGLAGIWEPVATEMPSRPNDTLPQYAGIFEDCHLSLEILFEHGREWLTATPNTTYPLMRRPAMRFPIQAISHDAFFLTGSGAVFYPPVGDVRCNLVRPFGLIRPRSDSSEFLYSNASAYRRASLKNGSPVSRE